MQGISRPSSNCREGRRAHRKRPWLTRAICLFIDWAVRLDGVRRGLCGRRAEERRAIASIGVRVGGKKVGQRLPSVSRAASCRRVVGGLRRAAGSRSERRKAQFEQQRGLERVQDARTRVRPKLVPASAPPRAARNQPGSAKIPPPPLRWQLNYGCSLRFSSADPPRPRASDCSCLVHLLRARASYHGDYRFELPPPVPAAEAATLRDRPLAARHRLFPSLALRGSTLGIEYL